MQQEISVTTETRALKPLPLSSAILFFRIPTALLDPANVTNVFFNALGPNVKGNWGLVVFTLVLLFFNIIRIKGLSLIPLIGMVLGS